MELFSFSRLDTYESCHRKFYYKYILKWKDIAGLPAIFGKTVHKSIELVFNGRSFEDAVATAWLEEAGIPGVKKDEVEAHARNALNVELFKGDGLTEEHFVMTLADGVKFQGHIDRIVLDNQVPYVIDWKTGRVMQKVMDKKQATLYAAHVMDKYNVPFVHGVLFFTRFNRISKAIIARDAAEKAKEWAVRTAREIQGKISYLPMLTKKEIINFAFRSNPGSACKLCCWGMECLADDGR